MRYTNRRLPLPYDDDDDDIWVGHLAGALFD